MDNPHWLQLPVSMVASANKTETYPATFGEVLEGIRSGKWERPVKRVRERYARAFKIAEEEGNPDPVAAAKKAADELKRDLPAATPSGLFSERVDSAIEAHSGFLCIDADNCAEPAVMRAKLANDPYVQAAFISPTGTGCKALVRILADAGTHAGSFAAARKHFKEAHGIAIDEMCKNLSRLCFVSHDVNIFIREQAAALLEPVAPEQQIEPHAPPPVRDIDAELTAKCGPAYYVTKKGGVVINENYFVQRICRENLVLFEQDETRFYRYSANTGSWEAVVPEIIKELVRSEWERFTRVFNEPGLAFKVDDHRLTALVSGIKAHSGRNKVFKRLKNIIHCANGILHIAADGSWNLMPFSPGYYARNPIPIAWVENAACPKFDALLDFALPPDDVSLFWRWFGSVLLTGNAAQRIMLFIGKAHSGKSTIAELVEMVAGLINCTALRTKLLHERFEIGRLFGYTLLTAKDVPGDFLEEDGAQALKKLVGHDYTPGERKGSMESVPIYGDYDCLVTCNERLLVRLEGEDDVGAWKRRLMVLKFLNVIAEKERIENYARVLFAEEGPGILRSAVEGAIAHLAELKDGGNFKESAEQKTRVDHLLAESESVRYFVTERVYRARGGAGLSTEELVSAYIDYCNDRNWRPYGIKQAERKLPDLMMAIHGVHVGAHIMRGGKRVRGYPHVALAQPDDIEDGEYARVDDEEAQGEL